MSNKNALEAIPNLVRSGAKKLGNFVLDVVCGKEQEFQWTPEHGIVFGKPVRTPEAGPSQSEPVATAQPSAESDWERVAKASVQNPDDYWGAHS